MVRSARLLILDWVIVQSAEYGHTLDTPRDVGQWTERSFLPEML